MDPDGPWDPYNHSQKGIPIMYITMKTKAYLYPTSIFIDHALCNNSTLMFMEHAQEWLKLSINLIIMTIHLEIE